MTSDTWRARENVQPVQPREKLHVAQIVLDVGFVYDRLKRQHYHNDLLETFARINILQMLLILD